MPASCTVQQPPFERNLVEALASLSVEVFGVAIDDLQWRLEKMPNVSVICARNEGRLIGFKAGYAMSQTKYYSWLGGVHPDFRRQGIASQLMELQHNWVSEQRFKVVETAANQDNTAMTQANLKHGFVVCGIRNEPHRVQILFSKSLP